MSSNTRSLQRRLLAGTAFVAVIAALPVDGARAVASVDLDFGSGVVQSSDFGSVLSQGNAAPVAGTGSGSSTTLNLLDNTAADVTYGGAYSLLNNSVATSGTANLSTAAVNLAFTPGLGTDSAATGSFQTNSAAVSASNIGSQHSVTLLNSDAGFENILTGTLSVDNNDLTASATANDASASIALASGVDLTGTGAAASVAIDETLAAAPDSATDADLLVASAQQTSGDVTATVTATDLTGSTNSTSPGDGSVDVLLESVNGATVRLANSDVTTTATGNTLSGDITSTDATATLSASAAVTGLQDLAGSVVANNYDATVRVMAGIDHSDTVVGSADASSLTVADTAVTATATGNASNQTIALNANRILGSGIASVYDGNTGAADVQLAISGAELAVASVQTLADGETVSSLVNAALVQVRAGDADAAITGSELSLLSNTIEAASTGSSAVNGLSLTAGSTLSAPGAVVAVQSIDGDVSATLDGAIAQSLLEDTTVGSTVVNAGNAIGASVIGGAATNDIIATTDSLSLDTSGGSASIAQNATIGSHEIPQVSAGFVLVNDQSIGGTLTGGTASALTATATGVRVLTNYRAGSVADAISSTVHTGGYADANGVLVEPGNTLSASVVGNTADNGIALSFTALQGDATGDGEYVAAIGNSQVIQGGSALTARIVGVLGEPVKAYIDGRATDSTVTTSYNTVAASAIGNRTTANSLTVSATDVVLAAAAVFDNVSVQEFRNSSISASQVNTGGTVSNTVATTIARAIDGSTVTSAENTLSATATANSASNSVTLGTDATASIQATTLLNNAQVVAGGTISSRIGVQGTGGNLNNAGVRITAGGTISGSQVDVTGNTVVGEVKANTALNTLAVTGTIVSSGSTSHGLINDQSVDAASALTSNVAGSFAIVESADRSVTGSSLAVSDNLQQSYATANTATNTVTLHATTSDVATLAVNTQTLAGPVTANGTGVVTTSDLEVTASAGVTASDLTLDGNRNQSVATGNLETSTLTIAATNVDPVPGSAGAGHAEYGSLPSGNATLSSEQGITGAPTVSASATTNVFNHDATDASARIVDQSTVSLGSNQTTAQATGNSSSLD
ncbi:MAG: hypothetical protein KDC18_17710, partial [Alphaproteobacteria bacterium]|nr:hypothetical protein [Alphaproteobacteria bacterium]